MFLLSKAQRQARLAELQAFADRTKAHLSVIRLQRAFRNFRLRRMFKERMYAISAIQVQKMNLYFLCSTCGDWI